MSCKAVVHVLRYWNNENEASQLKNKIWQLQSLACRGKQSGEQFPAYEQTDACAIVSFFSQGQIA